MIPDEDRSKWLLLELPLAPYAEIQTLQADCAAARRAGRLAQDLFILLEHPPVFTLGRNGGRENLTVSDAFLAEAGVAVVASERGGNITYHGPGQIVGYPIVDLDAGRRGVADYVGALEAVMLEVAAAFGVSAGRNPRNSGIWAGNRKLGSIGLCLRHGVSFHGFALNANNDLTPFAWINPCGMADVAMTSLARERGRDVDAAELRRSTRQAMAEVFGVDFRSVGLEDLRAMAGASAAPPAS
jgi:lipoate-protein ligase B